MCLHVPYCPTDVRGTSKFVTRQPNNRQPAFGLTIQIHSAADFFLPLAIFRVICLLQKSLSFVATFKPKQVEGFEHLGTRQMYRSIECSKKNRAGEQQ